MHAAIKRNYDSGLIEEICQGSLQLFKLKLGHYSLISCFSSNLLSKLMRAGGSQNKHSKNNTGAWLHMATYELAILGSCFANS